jgi:hypothetical protein
MPTQTKINLAAENTLAERKIDPADLEKATSFSNILNKGFYNGITNTAFSALGALMGLGIAMTLQALMPSQR